MEVGGTHDEKTLVNGALQQIRIGIVDDHDLAREGLKDMLADEPDMKVVGEASNGREALNLCARCETDLVLMDVRMPEMDGLTATREIKQRYPGISVLMVTMHENPDYLLEALKAGAAGYVLKDAPQHEVISAIRQLRNGELPLDAQLAARLLRRIAVEEEGQNNETPVKSRPFDGTVKVLTQREIEVLEFMKLGWTNRQIAQKLFISPGTVKNHVEHIISKLGVSDRTQAVVYSLEVGLIDFSA